MSKTVNHGMQRTAPNAAADAEIDVPRAQDSQESRAGARQLSHSSLALPFRVAGMNKREFAA
jgi:hypothetical protein